MQAQYAYLTRQRGVMTDGGRLLPIEAKLQVPSLPYGDKATAQEVIEAARGKHAVCNDVGLVDALNHGGDERAPEVTAPLQSCEPLHSVLLQP